ncbi:MULTISPECIES: hypothetical protein [unclassified Herbaspirillum]|uniref:hypothetical protein n=1 Tax=unclassified Herbaspirillum TaxID=2624150 RepID=UPI00116C82DF|nr:MULTISPECIES: hypothetical protein [unclassified Herbaspirillum]MBB5391357.1 hypothetical protein [Herbaspirillum sp. SJZ102]TQK12956.1 hypothetical protein FB599_0363 [Herbaspirillum sp. SJZ130]TQK14960.1 hypothetical protein FB598_0301 [Herbaspirillum sp. SJZ106]TWC67315.1 hypothetical protein FB597_104125 [Herbaspirillum sp. SJZ099]
MSLAAKQSHVQEPIAPMSHEDAMAIIERAARDKHLARDLDLLRDKCFSFVNAMMDEVTQTLAEKEKRTPALLKSRPEQEVTAISLRAAGQQREEAARKRRELAEAMVMGALANMDNPDWDPRNPATRHTTDNFFMALLKSAFK